MADSDIYNLEFLSLVAKITQEINNHTGLTDKTLAEFVISLHDQSKSLPDFKDKLREVGANFPDSFIENVDRLILTLHPKHKKKINVVGKDSGSGDGAAIDETDKKKRLFPGLALQDQGWQPSLTKDGKDVIMKEVDDLMSQFEGGAKKARPRPTEDDRSPKRQRRSRSRSPPRRRSPSPIRGRGHDDRRDDRRGRGDRGRQVDERPVLFKIYDGRVNGLKEFGAFVQLEGIAGRVEGMSAVTVVLFASSSFV